MRSALSMLVGTLGDRNGCTDFFILRELLSFVSDALEKVAGQLQKFRNINKLEKFGVKYGLNLSGICLKIKYVPSIGIQDEYYSQRKSNLYYNSIQSHTKLLSL